MIVMSLSPVRSTPAAKLAEEIGMDLRSTGNIDPEDTGSNPSTEPSMGELIERRLGRRAALRGPGGRRRGRRARPRASGQQRARPADRPLVAHLQGAGVAA